MHSFIPVALIASAAGAAATSISVTPHASYSSSIGVLGCKINTNRVAYWPETPDCNNICVQVTYQGRSVNLLRIDQSGGAHDISYDAWNYLQTGESATTNPIAGGGVDMDYVNVDASECASLMTTDGNKLAFSAANSMNFVSSCIADSGSWVGQNYVLYNIQDSACSWGYDETCTLNLAVSNQPSCPHTLGSTNPLTTDPVYNIEYPTGKEVLASQSGVTNAIVAKNSTTTTGNTTTSSTPSPISGSGRQSVNLPVMFALLSGVVALPALGVF